MHKNKKKFLKLRRDGLIFILSISVALLLYQIDAFKWFISLLGGSPQLTAFIAGIFFTSLFTSPVAIAVLGSLSIANPGNIFLISLFGGLGSVVGDLLIFSFIKNFIAEDMKFLMSEIKIKRYSSILHMRAFRWLVPFVGALIIASPLPDELGLIMMGISKTRFTVLIPISFIMSFIGIVGIAYAASAL